MRGFLSFKVHLVAFSVGVLCAGVWVVIAQSESDAGQSPEASPSRHNGGCQLTNRYKDLVAQGWLTERRACATVKDGEEAIAAKEHASDPAVPSELSLRIEGGVPEDLVQDCHAGDFHSDSGPEADALHCNAMLRIAAGELEPTETCSPPDCPLDGTPVWSYSEAELRDLASGRQ